MIVTCQSARILLHGATLLIYRWGLPGTCPHLLNKQCRGEAKSAGQKGGDHRGQDRPSFHGGAALG